MSLEGTKITTKARIHLLKEMLGDGCANYLLDMFDLALTRSLFSLFPPSFLPHSLNLLFRNVSFRFLTHEWVIGLSDRPLPIQ